MKNQVLNELTIVNAPLMETFQTQLHVINEAFEDLVFASSPLEDHIIHTMWIIDASIHTWRIMDPRWICMRIAISELLPYKKLLHLINDLARQRDSVPGRLRGVVEISLSAAIHFIFDLASVLGFGSIDFMMERFFASLTELASMYPVAHRKAHTGEAHQWEKVGYDVGVASQIDTVMRYHDSNIARAHMVWFNVFRLVAQLIRLDASEYTASDHLLEFQLKTDLCPHIVSIVNLYGPTATWYHDLLNLIQLCRSQLDSLTLLQVSFGFGTALSSGMERFIPRYELDPQIYDRKGVSKKRLLSLVQTRPVLYYKESTAFLKPRAQFASSADFESHTKALGRALALAMRHGNKISDLVPIESTIFRGIFDDIPISALRENIPYFGELTTEKSPEETLLILKENFYEPMFYIRLGFQDVFGPLGIQLFSSTEWEKYLSEGLVRVFD